MPLRGCHCAGSGSGGAVARVPRRRCLIRAGRFGGQNRKATSATSTTSGRLRPIILAPPSAVPGPSGVVSNVPSSASGSCTAACAAASVATSAVSFCSAAASATTSSCSFTVTARAAMQAERCKAATHDAISRERAEALHQHQRQGRRAEARRDQEGHRHRCSHGILGDHRGGRRLGIVDQRAKHEGVPFRDLVSGGSTTSTARRARSRPWQRPPVSPSAGP